MIKLNSWKFRAIARRKIINHKDAVIQELIDTINILRDINQTLKEEK